MEKNTAPFETKTNVNRNALTVNLIVEIKN